ncbi:hypothetical protein CDEST_14791 [Colletotrichum destructivum]|uniref:Uncharacterized protein n=1 Tax=Colletotrichum destructivum TaxID=34406 RepID=A0AAX4J338_9PEZI|nr:hypothetical protein CDEST_14791 [Colletotrichum destructivum]
MKIAEEIKPCPDQKTCLTSSQERHTPPPAHHFHLHDPEVTTLCFLPVLDRFLFCPPCPDVSKLPPHFTLASDEASLLPWRPGRGSGVFKPDSGPVVVPKAHVLLEAFLRLYARDSAKRIGAFSIAMIGYVEQYIDDDGLLDASRLPEPLRTSYMDLRQGSKPVRKWTRELKQALQLPQEEGESDEEDDC